MHRHTHTHTRPHISLVDSDMAELDTHPLFQFFFFFFNAIHIEFHFPAPFLQEAIHKVEAARERREEKGGRSERDVCVGGTREQRGSKRGCRRKENSDSLVHETCMAGGRVIGR